MEGSEHTGGSPSSSPCDHKHLLKHAREKRNVSQKSPNGRKWRNTCRGRVRPTVFVGGKSQFVENSSSGEESELSSVTDDSLHSDTDNEECSEEPLVDLPAKTPIVENSEDSGSGKTCNIWNRKIVRRKRAKFVVNKKQVKKRRTVVPMVKPELSEESVENLDPNTALRDAASPVRCVTPVKESGDKKAPGSSSGSPVKNCDVGKKHRQDVPEVLPELVKAVLERDERGFRENLDGDMYDCRQYLANLRPPHHVPVPG